MRFPPALEAAYAQARWQARLRFVDFYNLLGSAGFCVASLSDASHRAAEASDTSALRWSLMALLFALTFLEMWRGTSRRTWEPDLVNSVGFATTTAYALWLFHLDAGLLSAMSMAYLLMPIMHCALLVRQQFRHALGLTVALLIACALVTANTAGAVRMIADGNLRLLFTGAVLSLAANFMLERRQRQAYVLHLGEDAHQAALANGVQTLHRLSHCDALTGVANRRHFDTLLDQAWLDAGQTGRLALLLLDIDHFKRYNDHYGHPAGDTCLQAVAGAIDAVARAHGGTAARIGGEEFAVLLPGLATLAGAEAAASATCAAVRRLAIDHARSASGAIVTVSVGVAVACPADGHGIASVQAAADAALYAAKDAGRDRWAAAPMDALPARVAQPASQNERPAAAAQPAPTDDPLSIWRNRLHGELHRTTWRLAFFPELEADYDRHASRGRGLRLCVLGLVGVLLTVVYNRVAGPMYPDLSGILNDAMRTVSLDIFVPWALLMLLPMRSWLRESIFALAAVMASVTYALVASAHPTLLAQSNAIGAFLAPMFCAVIIEQPFRYCFVPSIATLLISSWVLWPGANSGDTTTAWEICTGTFVMATLYSLTASYLLDHISRRNYVLMRLDEAHSVAMQRQTKHLRHLTTIDAVTGIANRRRYDEAQARLWADCAAAGRPLALLLLDVDHFKRYNDVYGHPAGDACLRNVALALSQWSDQRVVRGGMPGLAARLGGEEFGVLLPGCDAAEAPAEAASLCAAVAGLCIEHTGSTTATHLTVSIGAAAVTPSGTGLASAAPGLLSAADAALYRAKQAGRNCARA